MRISERWPGWCSANYGIVRRSGAYRRSPYAPCFSVKCGPQSHLLDIRLCSAVLDNVFHSDCFKIFNDRTQLHRCGLEIFVIGRGIPDRPLLFTNQSERRPAGRMHRRINNCRNLACDTGRFPQPSKSENPECSATLLSEQTILTRPRDSTTQF